MPQFLILLGRIRHAKGSLHGGGGDGGGGGLGGSGPAAVHEEYDIGHDMGWCNTHADTTSLHITHNDLYLHATICAKVHNSF